MPQAMRLAHAPSNAPGLCTYVTNGRTNEESLLPMGINLMLGNARGWAAKFILTLEQSNSASRAEHVHSATNPGMAGMGSGAQSGDATGVLSPEIDIAEIVGAMPARACECLFADCHLHGRGCDRVAKWTARVHAWINRTDTNHYQVFNLCDDCKKRLEAHSLRLTRTAARSCTCGMAGKSVSDYIGPVMPL